MVTSKHLAKSERGGNGKGAPRRRNNLNKFSRKEVLFGGMQRGVKKILYERVWGGQSAESLKVQFKRSRGRYEGFEQRGMI